MRTTLEISDDLMRALLARHPGATKTEAVEVAIAEYLRRDGTSRLRSIAGSLQIEDASTALRSRDRTT